MATVIFLKDHTDTARGTFKKGAEASLPYATFRDLEAKGIVGNKTQPIPKVAAMTQASELAALKAKVAQLQTENAELKAEQESLLKANDELAAQVESLTKPEPKK